MAASNKSRGVIIGYNLVPEIFCLVFLMLSSPTAIHSPQRCRTCATIAKTFPAFRSQRTQNRKTCFQQCEDPRPLLSYGPGFLPGFSRCWFVEENLRPRRYLPSVEPVNPG